MVNGIPAFCVYYKSKYDEDTFYVPTKIVTGANDEAIIQMFNEALKNTPLKKAAEPKDIANTALYLASNLSDHVTGEAIYVTGGM